LPKWIPITVWPKTFLPNSATKSTVVAPLSESILSTAFQFLSQVKPISARPAAWSSILSPEPPSRLPSKKPLQSDAVGQMLLLAQAGSIDGTGFAAMAGEDATTSARAESPAVT
jgi:hypothetical protein